MAKLTDAQRGWLETIRDSPGGLLSRMHIPIGHGGSIPSLIRRGLAEWHSRSFLKLTDAGRAALTKDTQP